MILKGALSVTGIQRLGGFAPLVSSAGKLPDNSVLTVDHKL